MPQNRNPASHQKVKALKVANAIAAEHIESMKDQEVGTTVADAENWNQIRQATCDNTDALGLLRLLITATAGIETWSSPEVALAITIQA